jgi:hypothetical protein
MVEGYGEASPWLSSAMMPLPARTALAAVLLFSIGTVEAADVVRPAGQPGDAIFSAEKLPRFHIEIPESELAKLRFGAMDYVRALVRVDGASFPEVGLRLKGRGSFRPVTDKPSLAVKFDAYLPRQSLFGLTKVMLNNASQDSTLLSEYLASTMFCDAGVPAARVTHARVELNGRDLGFYVLAEAMNKTFLRQHFDNPHGTLYEGYATDVDQTLDLDSGVSGDQSDRRVLVAAAKLPPAERWASLAKSLDLDRFVSFLGVSIMSAQHDSYPLNKNNYRLYRDPDTDRFVMLPHGIDGSFSRITMPIEPPRKYVLTGALMELLEGQELYRRRFDEVFTNVFNLARITNRVIQATARLLAAAADETERAARQAAATSMLHRVARRHQNVANQLAGRVSSLLEFGPDHRATPAGWEAELATTGMTAERHPFDEAETLYLRVEGSSRVATGSWRTFVSLSPGAYRFVGRVRVRGISQVTPAGSVGAALRISGAGNGARRLAANDQWTVLEYRFDVRESGDTQLVCELRASTGEAWFDLQSLQLVKE